MASVANVLGIPETSPIDQGHVITAFSKLAIQRHPDQQGCTPESRAEFRRIKAAFVALMKASMSDDEDVLEPKLDPRLVASGSVPDLDLLREALRALRPGSDMRTVLDMGVFREGPCSCKECRKKKVLVWAEEDEEEAAGSPAPQPHSAAVRVDTNGTAANGTSSSSFSIHSPTSPASPPALTVPDIRDHDMSHGAADPHDDDADQDGGGDADDESRRDMDEEEGASEGESAGGRHDEGSEGSGEDEDEDMEGPSRTQSYSGGSGPLACGGTPVKRRTLSATSAEFVPSSLARGGSGLLSSSPVQDGYPPGHMPPLPRGSRGSASRGGSMSPHPSAASASKTGSKGRRGSHDLQPRRSGSAGPDGRAQSASSRGNSVPNSPKGPRQSPRAGSGAGQGRENGREVKKGRDGGRDNGRDQRGQRGERDQQEPGTRKKASSSRGTTPSREEGEGKRRDRRTRSASRQTQTAGDATDEDEPLPVSNRGESHHESAGRAGPSGTAEDSRASNTDPDTPPPAVHSSTPASESRPPLPHRRLHSVSAGDLSGPIAASTPTGAGGEARTPRGSQGGTPGTPGHAAPTSTAPPPAPASASTPVSTPMSPPTQPAPVAPPPPAPTTPSNTGGGGRNRHGDRDAGSQSAGGESHRGSNAREPGTPKSSASGNPPNPKMRTRICSYFSQPHGCINGDRCKFLHVLDPSAATEPFNNGGGNNGTRVKGAKAAAATGPKGRDGRERRPTNGYGRDMMEAGDDESDNVSGLSNPGSARRLPTGSDRGSQASPSSRVPNGFWARGGMNGPGPNGPMVPNGPNGPHSRVPWRLSGGEDVSYPPPPTGRPPSSRGTSAGGAMSSGAGGGGVSHPATPKASGSGSRSVSSRHDPDEYAPYQIPIPMPLPGYQMTVPMQHAAMHHMHMQHAAMYSMGPHVIPPPPAEASRMPMEALPRLVGQPGHMPLPQTLPGGPAPYGQQQQHKWTPPQQPIMQSPVQGGYPPMHLGTVQPPQPQTPPQAQNPGLPSRPSSSSLAPAPKQEPRDPSPPTQGGRQVPVRFSFPHGAPPGGDQPIYGIPVFALPPEPGSSSSSDAVPPPPPQARRSNSSSVGGPAGAPPPPPPPPALKAR